MSRFIKFGNDNVLYSIINTKNNLIFKDNIAPYSFNDFLKNTNEEYTPTQYNDFYLSYLKQWYLVKNNVAVSEQNLIQQQYITLLKDITLNYTTNAEKKFISNIDFNNPDDLEVIIPFYSRKIKSVVEFYKSTRDKTKTVTLGYKQKGTNIGIEDTIKTNVLNYLFDNQLISSDNLTYKSLQRLIEIEVEELVDTFGNYFNLSVDPAETETDLRKSLYTSNYNVIDSDVFINFGSVLRKTIFNKVFLKQLGFGIGVNVNLTYDPYCATNTPLGNLIKQKTVGGISPTDKIYYQQRLLEKFMGVDVHYVYRDTTGQAFSGVLITAAYPSSNLLNVTNPSTATVPSDEFEALKKIGLYFRPDHLGVLKFDVREKTFRIDTSVLAPNIVYIYPDPTVYGNVQYSGITPVVYDVDYSQDIQFISSTFSYGDPKINSTDQPYYAYTSRQQKQSNLGIANSNFSSSITQLPDIGYTHTFNTDIYGNQYFLQKSGYSRNTSANISLANGLALNTTLDNTLLSSSQTVFAPSVDDVSKPSVIEKATDVGNIFVKNVVSSSINPLSSELQTTFSKYLSTVRDELVSSVLNFDVLYDSIIIQTPNYCVFETLVYDVDRFVKPNTSNTYITIDSTDRFQNISNRVFVAGTNKVYLYTTSAFSVYKDDYNKIIYPVIYSFDITSKKLNKIFPLYISEITSLSSLFCHSILFNSTVTPQQVNITDVHQATISYNSYNNLFNITYVGKDSNDAFYIFNHNFSVFDKTLLFDEVGNNAQVQFLQSYVVDTQGANLSIQLLKNTSNFYALSSSSSIVTNISGAANQAMNIFPASLTFNSVLAGPDFVNMTIDNSAGIILL